MKKLTAVLLAGGLLSLPGLASAAGDLSYTFIEGDYLNLSIDPFDDEGTLIEDFDDGNGWAVRGSFALAPMFFLFGDYSSVDSDATFLDEDVVLFTSDRDVKRITAGAGFNMPIFEGSRNQIDLVARGAYVDLDYGDFDFGAGSDDDDLDDFLDDLNEDSSDGFFVDGRLRTQLISWLELSAGARYTEVEDANSVGFVGGALIEIGPAFGINIEVDAGDDVSEVMVGARLSFNTFD